jgi:valyl-tRNA synthetase
MTNESFEKAYCANDYEDEIYAAWDKSGFFNPDNLTGEPYSIMMPPPNVTGVLHLGHALENTIMDSMIRYQRLRGKKALLLPGTDHAAVATQARVEKNLVKEGIENPREHFGREGLLEKIREYAESSKATILKQVKKMGTSADWSRLAYTFDEDRSKAVNEVFVRMYNDGLIYRGYRVVNWSCKGQSTCSDDELVHVDRMAKMYTFKYSEDFPFTIATTRPETKLGDTAVAVHPSDERYQEYIGKTFDVDFCGNKLSLKVIADDGVDPELGTGALGVTPAHSQVDFEMYEKQKAAGNEIDLIEVIGPDGKMTTRAGSAFEGLAVEDAREKVVEQLKANGLFVSEEEIEQSAGTSDRFGDVVEAVPMTQWFVGVNRAIPEKGKTLKELMKEAVDVGHNGDPEQKVNISPARFEKNYYGWIDNLRDWCISRQIWWGHRIPVWYKGDEVFCGLEAPEGEGWVQDEDTLDTWFSSGLWTFSTLGWPEKTEDLKGFHPTSWMQMGYEILFFWLARMVLMSTYTLDEIPFKDVYIHGMLRDKDGQKFSKSLGNGIDPIEVVEKYGADALRFSLIAGVTPGNDARFYDEKVESGQHLVNKFWNISRYILTSVEEVDHGVAGTSLQLQTLADKWILSRLHTLEKDVAAHMEKYEFSQVAEKLREFTWSEFADWYLEVSKAQRADEATKKSTEQILVYVLEHLLVYWHPIMPFMTEVIWKHVDEEKMLMVHGWPQVPDELDDSDSSAKFGLMQDFVGAIRNIRATYKVDQKKKISISVSVASGDVEQYESWRETVKSLAGVGEMSVITDKLPTEGVASAVCGDAKIAVDLSGLVDLEKEKARLESEIEETQTYLVSLEKKLSNDEFTNKAPAQVVDSMREKEKEAQGRLAALKERLTAF